MEKSTELHPGCFDPLTFLEMWYSFGREIRCGATSKGRGGLGHWDQQFAQWLLCFGDYNLETMTSNMVISYVSTVSVLLR